MRFSAWNWTGSSQFEEFKAERRLVHGEPPGLVQQCCHIVEQSSGHKVLVLAIVDEEQMQRHSGARARSERIFVAILAFAVCRNSTRRIRSRSGTARCIYEPAEADCKIKGGNSNWRGPIWFPTSFLMIESLAQSRQGLWRHVDGQSAGRRREMTLTEMAEEVANRLIKMFVSRPGRPPPHLRRDGEIPDRSALERPHPVLRILPRRQRRGARRITSDRMDGAGGFVDR